MTKKILVTGATGFIGGQLAKRLMRDGWHIRLLVRDTAKLPAALQGVDIVKGELADMSALERAVSDVSIIFHCAANVKTWDTREAYEATNVTGVKNLLSAIVKVNPTLSRLVHISTIDVYGFPHEPCDEKSETSAKEFGYGVSKLQGETLVRKFCTENHIPYTILRPSNVIGPGSQFIERIGKELVSGMMLKIDGGHVNAGFVYIDNLLDYLLWAAQAENAVAQCYNVRDRYDATWAEFITTFRTAINGKGIVINLPYWVANTVASLLEAFYRVFLPAREPFFHRLLVRVFGRTCGHSAEKIYKDSGIDSRIGFDEAMKRSADWLLANTTL